MIAQHCWPDWIAGTFFGTRRAAEFHISRSSVCRGSGKGVNTITQEYRESKRAEDQEAGPVGAPGTWPARSAGKHDIVPDVCITNRTRYRYMEDINYWNIRYRIKTIRYWYPTSIYGRYWPRDIRYRYRYRIITFDIGWQGGVKTSISKVFSSISNTSISGPILGGKDMQILNIGRDIEGFFFDIEYIPSISKYFSSISNTIFRYRVRHRLLLSGTISGMTISNNKYDIGYDIGYK